MKKRIPLLTTLLLASGMTFAAGTFEEKDLNNDGMLSKYEYNNVMGDTTIYTDWDVDRDGLLNEDEIGANVRDVDFDLWDTDRDGYVNDTEFYGGTFDYYDDDENGHWDGDEWDDAGDEGWFDI